jgi:uncharacterized protein (TIGR00106 family)
MAICQVSVVPLGTKTTSLSPFVAQLTKRLDTLPVKHQLTPMGTILEGSLDQIFEAIRAIHEVPFEHGAARVMTLINLDDRRDKKATAQGKVDSVLEKLRVPSLTGPPAEGYNRTR